MAPSGIRWTDKTLFKKADQIDPQMHRYFEATTKRQAALAQADMRKNAPWTDRTGNARAGLKAKPEFEGSTGSRTYRIILSHSMHYGLFLETRWAGRYAIIEPTVKRQQEDFMRIMTRVLQRGLK